MARQGTWMVASLLVHGGLAVGIGTISVEQSRAATAIAIAEVKKKKPEAPPPPPPTKVEPPEPKRRQARALARPLAPTPPPQAPAPDPKAAPADLPDFGLTLSGSVGGGGISVPGGAPGAGAQRPAAARPSRPAPVAANALPGDGCADPPAKPKPLSVPQPSYPDAARAAGVEGKVRVELTVDETGKVVSVRVLSGLGHGLDEAALAAARQATFQPALRCGRPARATFTISMRFTAS